jgi:integrase
LPAQHTGKETQMRTPSAKTKSDQLQTVITDTLKLWRRYHLTYDQTRYVAKEVRRALAIARPPARQRVITRLSRVEEERLIGQAYRISGVRGLLIKTLFQTGARVSEFVHLQVVDVYFDEQMLLGRPGNGIPFLCLGVPGEDLPVTGETLPPGHTRLLVPASPSSPRVGLHRAICPGARRKSLSMAVYPWATGLLSSPTRQMP